MNTPAPRPRSTRQALAGREFALGRVAKPNLVTVGWRWRYELLLAVAAPMAVWLLGTALGATFAALAIAGLIALVGLSHSLRKLLVARAWCIITPHRVRTGMAQAWIHSRDGKMPFVLRTSPEPFGERVRLWCRAGTSAEDFVWARHLIAAACWAREVQVLRNERFVHIVVLDVIRHVEGHPVAAHPARRIYAEIVQQEESGTGPPDEPWVWTDAPHGGESGQAA